MKTNKLSIFALGIMIALFIIMCNVCNNNMTDANIVATTDASALTPAADANKLTVEPSKHKCKHNHKHDIASTTTYWAPEGLDVIRSNPTDVSDITKWTDVKSLPKVGDLVTVAFFEDLAQEFKVTAVDNGGVEGVVTVSMKIDDDDNALDYCIVSVNKDNIVLANYTNGSHDINYGIRYDHMTKQHYAVEFTNNGNVDCACSHEHDAGNIDGAKIEAAKATMSGYVLPKNYVPPANLYVSNTLCQDTILTLPILYKISAQAKLWANTNEGAYNLSISQALARSNIVAANSKLTCRFVCAGIKDFTVLNLADEANSTKILTQFTRTYDGYYDNVNAERTLAKADLVQIITKTEDAGGLGWIYNGYEAYGYSLVRVQQLSWTLTAVHELGHNLGAGHARDQVSSPGPSTYCSYAAGFRITRCFPGIKSVMAYGNGTVEVTAPYFSSPYVNINGFTFGSYTCNNTSAINSTVRRVATFRQ